MSIIFENEGLVDLRAIKTFGVSAKENENPIGFFGTGLKYALAVLLREGQKIEIFVGTDSYKFTTKTVKIRNEEFKIVCMNDEELGFTTHVGANWELWQAFRELHANCLDEAGRFYYHQSNSGGLPNYTRVVVSGARFTTTFEDREKFLLEREPIFKTLGCEMHSGVGSDMFYRNYKAHSLHPEHSLFTYNILGKVHLTEDRTIAYKFQAMDKIRDMVFQIEDRILLREFLCAPENSIENDVDYNCGTPPKLFMEVAIELVQNRGLHINKSLIPLVKRLSKKSFHPLEILISDYQQKILDKSIEVSKAIGFPVNDYPILVVDRLGDGIWGMAEDGKIYLAQELFQKGVKETIGTIIEEFIHLKYNLYDNTREMQNFLFDRMVSIALEHVVGETL